MGCCDKAKKFIDKGAMILEGNMKSIVGIEEPFSKKRLEVCMNCDQQRIRLRMRFCGICHCLLQSAIRVERKHCPCGKWENGHEITND
jgi:hypothetical protein